MRRADRRTPNDDNARNNPRSQKKEPTPPRELEQLLANVRAQRDEWKQKAKENEEAATQLVTYQLKVNEWQERVTQNYQLYIEEKQKHQQTLCLYNEEKAKATEWLTKYQQADARREHYLTLYNEEQQKHQQTLCLYNEEKAKATEWLAKYQQADAQRQQYLTLYNEVKEELKYERRSKASIKGWETRRKRENERLKREIGEMTIVLRDSLERKEEAVNNLYILAERMDRIQQLVDSVEEESTNTPVGLLQKFQRIWLAIKEILAE
ncbi:MAG: hypothetical protein IGR93_05680 [Hydrococcus sp. C42_A2020_068]|uniref:hypothetical protein n=1 Tax=Pleurocapsa sp. PCC 7327 TaxID=118163 RepID=UPI00029FF38A|nr:hypothetical protein [Pleurocapsa sp. PCC 7327]AFY77385.1 hypothetical protein Ple7327_2055 [Pleurocapsa sp. PCC 7327]MBF2019595.1 hypothetical protein [Hydrococcus sp. C42_A2020_068]